MSRRARRAGPRSERRGGASHRCRLQELCGRYDRIGLVARQLQTLVLNIVSVPGVSGRMERSPGLTLMPAGMFLHADVSAVST